MSERTLTLEQAEVVMELCDDVAHSLSVAPKEMKTSVFGRFEQRLDKYLDGGLTFDELTEALGPKRVLTEDEAEFLGTLQHNMVTCTHARMQS